MDPRRSHSEDPDRFERRLGPAWRARLRVSRLLAGSVLLMTACGSETLPAVDAPPPVISLEQDLRIDGHQETLTPVTWMGVSPDGAIALVLWQEHRAAAQPGGAELPGGHAYAQVRPRARGLDRRHPLGQRHTDRPGLLDLSGAGRRSHPATSAGCRVAGGTGGRAHLRQGLPVRGLPRRLHARVGHPQWWVGRRRGPPGFPRDVGRRDRARGHRDSAGRLQRAGRGRRRLPLRDDPVLPRGARIGVLATRDLDPTSGAYRVTVVDARGEEVFSREIAYEPVPVPDPVRDSAIQRVADRGEGVVRREMADRLREATPAFFPEAERLVLGSGGRVWVGLRERNDGNPWLVLSPAGEPWGRAVLPSNVRLETVTRTHVYGTERDEFDVESVVRYRIGRTR